MARGADDGADRLELFADLVVGERRTPAGNGLELVERAAGVPETATRELGDRGPHAATSGARMSEILSPTPPVECLSTVGRESRRQVEPLARLAIMRSVHVLSSSALSPLKKIAMSSAGHLLLGHLAALVGVEDPGDRFVAQHAAIALGGDESTAEK